MKVNTVNLSDNIEFIKTLSDNSIDAIITDSPYGLGKKQDMVKLLQAWIDHGYYEVKGKGFMGKHWDAFVPQPILWKECLRVLKPGGYLLSFFGTRTYHLGSLAIELAGFEIRDCIQWIYGSGFPKSKANLKPANEPICVARKPGQIIDLNIDDCRLGGSYVKTSKRGGMKQTNVTYGKMKNPESVESHPNGRFPANVLLDDFTAEIIDSQSFIVTKEDERDFKVQHGSNGKAFTTHKKDQTTVNYCDTGGASRFFFKAKADPYERAGCKHPTIKPVSLMVHLVKLYSPQRGVVLDPHSGTGRTAAACIITERNYIMVDNDPESVKESELVISLAKNGYFTKEKNYAPKVELNQTNLFHSCG